MPAKRIPTRTAAFRGALWITFAALISTALALTLQYYRTVAVLDTEARHMVQAEITSLQDRYRAGGVNEILRFVSARTQRDQGRDYVYVVKTSSGRIVAGDLPYWPTAVSGSGWFNTSVLLRTSQGAQRHAIEVRSIDLAPGYRLMVGHLADGRARLRERFFETLAWSLASTALIGLTLGWWISRRGLRFVERVTVTGERFLDGHLDERLPATGRGDEYDRLAEMVNACFGEVERMIASLRAATDGLAHDLKTPLTRIKARIELAVLRGAAGTPEVLAETVQDLDLLLKLINDLLGLARAEAITSDAFVNLDLAEIAREAADLYEPVAEADNRRMIQHTAPAMIQGVRPLLMHATVNLIDNAVKFAGSGGTIKVSTATRDGMVLLVVADTGPGIAAKDRDRAIARMTRLDTSRSTPGSGLGLSIVDAVARAHGGSLELCDNHPGLKAIIRLPTAANIGIGGSKAIDHQAGMTSM